MSSSKKFSKAHTASVKDREHRDASTPETLPNERLANEMATYGITRIPVDYYHYGAFRYTSLKDAIAQAKRERQS